MPEWPSGPLGPSAVDGEYERDIHPGHDIYVSKYEKHAMRWLFYLYKSKDGWVINTFNFDDQIQALFLH